MTDKKYYVRQLAARALGKIGPDAKAAVPYLIEALNDLIVQSSVTNALGEIGPNAKAAVPHLIEIVLNDPLDYSSAIIALGNIETAAPVVDRVNASGVFSGFP